MKRRMIMATAVTGVVTAGAAAAYMSSNRRAQREDCPGKIICPITGDLICADECPAETAKAVSLPVAEVPRAVRAGSEQPAARPR